MTKTINTCKIVIVGDKGVGKTSLVHSLVGKEKIIKITPGVKIENMLVDLGENITADVVFWNLEEDPHFRFFQQDVLECPNIVLLVYDLNNFSSLLHLENECFPMFEKNDTLKKSTPILIGNKIDLGQSINDKVIEDFIQKYGIPSFKISVKEKINIEEVANATIEIVKSYYKKKKQS
ncbi:MAG: hypothetical protein K9W46_03820 [Candidatus Heimdallarchaeum endolithica]|uniref:GTP-binding protein n=1 Tax=Candidatus Heimdallarchaeum endolithica TaxID=2876572 RepID=A0A9Y1BSK2_9ARCH|nr:MAG: hypothetical protein K9W46_03820 [Candidatus Heimdallarchaeum endolithica]